MIQHLLNKKLAEYHNSNFISRDPVQIPHRFRKRQDIEIAAFFAAVLAWGNRNSILQSAARLMDLMDNAPHDFVLHCTEADMQPMEHFVHRTFNGIDLQYFLHFLKRHYTASSTLETAFVPHGHYAHRDTEQALIHFHQYFCAEPHPKRTEKHIATPAKQSACKRLNMLLRWMVRRGSDVDFGLWHSISPAQLIMPVDVHVARTAFALGLLPNKQSNWKNAVLLTEKMRLFSPEDPVIYDYALFSIGAEEDPI
jgi:uncharacterized protein (TIGR02757 family)